MTTDEQKLHTCMRTSPRGHNPFRVPDGYFATLQGRITDRINNMEPAQKRREGTVTKAEASGRTTLSLHATQHRKLWMRLTVAAMLTGVVSVIGTMLYHQHPDATPMPVENTTSMSDVTDMEYGDEHLDYAMLSNSDIEYYLTSAE